MSMTADAESDTETKGKSSKLPLILGLVLALVGAGGGFFATQMGIVPGLSPSEPKTEMPAKSEVITEEVVFVSLDPITVTLPQASGRQLLRITTQLDVAPQNAAAVEAIKPRIIDILNTYLRAVDVTDIETPTALIRMRTQMLHRVQVVAGQGIVRDLLITEFILN